MSNFEYTNPTIITGLTLQAGDEGVFLNGATAVSLVALAGSYGDAGPGQYNYSGGVLIDTEIEGGYIAILGNGYDNIAEAIDSTISSGVQLIENSGISRNSTITGTGLETISSDGGSRGTAFSAVVMAGGIQMLDGNAIDTIVDIGGAQIIAADTMFSPIAGTASGTTIESGGIVVVEAYGTATGAVVEPGGYLIVLPGGAALDASFAGVGSLVTTGVAFVDPGEAATYAKTITAPLTVTAGGTLFVMDEGVASNDVLAGSYPPRTLFDPYPQPNPAVEVVYTGGTAVDDLVSYLGQLTLAGGVAIGTTIMGGLERLQTGASASNEIIHGVEIIGSGASGADDMISNFGAVTVYSGGTLTDSTIGPGGTLYFYEATSGADTNVLIDGGFADTGGVQDFTLGNHGTLAVEDFGSTSGAISFSGTGSILNLQEYSANDNDLRALTISGFSGTDTIEVTGIEATLVTYIQGTGLVVDGRYLDETIHFGGIIDAGALTFTSEQYGNLLITICYLRGTRIRTATGDVAIEDLAIGDFVLTRSSGLAPIKWIGRQSFDRRFIARNIEQWPIKISAGALAPNRPARDLFVSPGHSMLIGNTLILARNLINGVTITQNEPSEDVHFYNIELDVHDCLLAERTWSETYADCPGLRAMFHNASTYGVLYPDAPDCPPEPRLCAPRPTSGPALEAGLRRVAARAAAAAANGPLRGYIDLVSPSGNIEGWAQDLANPHLPILLEVLDGGMVIGTALACHHRADLAEAFDTAGNHAFHFFAPHVKDLSLRRAIDKANIPLFGMSDEAVMISAGA